MSDVDEPPPPKPSYDEPRARPRPNRRQRAGLGVRDRQILDLVRQHGTPPLQTAPGRPRDLARLRAEVPDAFVFRELEPQDRSLPTPWPSVLDI